MRQRREFSFSWYDFYNIRDATEKGIFFFLIWLLQYSGCDREGNFLFPDMTFTIFGMRQRRELSFSWYDFYYLGCDRDGYFLFPDVTFVWDRTENYSFFSLMWSLLFGMGCRWVLSFTWYDFNCLGWEGELYFPFPEFFMSKVVEMI